MEDYESIEINDDEMAKFISEKLAPEGILLDTDIILKVLDLELEYLSIKGVL